MAGLTLEALNQINLFLFAVDGGVSALVYFTFRRYVNDVKKAEGERAGQAEKHIVELLHHIAEQERISAALSESKHRFRHAAFHDALTDLPNRNQFRQLRLLGCEYGQGYLISRPVPADKVESFFTEAACSQEMLPKFDFSTSIESPADDVKTIG